MKRDYPSPPQVGSLPRPDVDAIDLVLSIAQQGHFDLNNHHHQHLLEPEPFDSLDFAELDQVSDFSLVVLQD